jgi:hypothetical protein
MRWLNAGPHGQICHTGVSHPPMTWLRERVQASLHGRDKSLAVRVVFGLPIAIRRRSALVAADRCAALEP